jgi:hypothetical protein
MQTGFGKTIDFRPSGFQAQWRRMGKGWIQVMKKLTVALAVLMWACLFMCKPMPEPVGPDAVSGDGGMEGNAQPDFDAQLVEDCFQSPEAASLPCGVDYGVYRAADAISRACLILRSPALKCPEGWPEAGSCEDTLSKLLLIGTWDRKSTDCIAASRSREDVRKCNVECK